MARSFTFDCGSEEDATSSRDEMAFDPSSLESQTADVADIDSDGFESNDEVKAVLDQLDKSVPLLNIHSRAIIDPVVSQDKLRRLMTTWRG
jgi:hypothetical protein